MTKRWYELTPDVCMVISKIEMSNGDDRLRYANQILKELNSNGYKPNYTLVYDKIKTYSMKRWYDQNRTLFLAFEYLKDAPDNIQSNVVTNVLNFMKKERVA